jgi:tRNA A-37 threonylcarbamoyl transferase component Bud32
MPSILKACCLTPRVRRSHSIPESWHTKWSDLEANFKEQPTEREYQGFLDLAKQVYGLLDKHGERYARISAQQKEWIFSRTYHKEWFVFYLHKHKPDRVAPYFEKLQKFYQVHYELHLGKQMRALKLTHSGFLGNGTFGEVSLFTSKNGEKVAVKTLRPIKINNYSSRRAMMNELKVAEQLPRHPNIVQFNAFYVMNFHAVEYPILCMQYASQDLSSYLEKNKLSKQQQNAFISQSAAAIKALHAKYIYHGDFCFDNCMVSMNTRYPRIVVSDFGSSRVYPTPMTVHTIDWNHVDFASPEAAKEHANNTHPKYTRNLAFAQDCYALGVLMHYIITLTTVWSDERIECPSVSKTILTAKCLFAIKTGAWKPKLDQCGNHANIISRLLNRDPLQRPTASVAHKETIEASVTEVSYI